MRVRVASSLTTTNAHGCLFSALGAKTAASSTWAIKSSGTPSGAKLRQARWWWTTSKKSGIDPPEGVDVEDAERRVPRPVVERRGPGTAAEVLRHPIGHAFEPFFRVRRRQLVQMQEAGVATGHVLIWRDHQALAVVARRDVPYVREVGPVPEGLSLIGLAKPDEHDQQPERRLTAENALPRPRIAAEVPALDFVGRLEALIDFTDPEERKLVDLARQVSPIRAGVLPPRQRRKPLQVLISLGRRGTNSPRGQTWRGFGAWLQPQPGVDTVLHRGGD